MNQAEKAAYFKSLHVKGSPVVLYNIWDAGGAKAIAKAGANAIATGSWSVAAAHGFGDGEAIPLDLVTTIVKRITQSVELPVSVDFEGAYAHDPEGVNRNVQKIIEAGAIGVNFEDRIVQSKGLHSITAQSERIKAIKEAAQQKGIPMFINARTDLFLGTDATEHENLIEEAIEREQAYKSAGADGFFIPGLTQPTLIKQIVDHADLPVNVMIKGDMNSLSALSDLGVARISYGPKPYADSISALVDRFNSIQ